MKTIFPWVVWALICGGTTGGVFYASKINAQPLYEAKSDTVRIVLYDEPCTLAEVSNLPHRVVWTENGQDIEGCWGAIPALGVVTAYFKGDRTVAAVPISAFHKVVGV